MSRRRAVPDLEPDFARGIRENLGQFLHQLLQVFFVGLTIGMMRTVVPALAEEEFGVPVGSFLLLTSFVVAFGVVKAVLNFIAGWLSERVGRRRVLLVGWAAAMPIPVIVYLAPDWNWIIAATVLLGVNQGLTWSMTQTSKLDLAGSDQRGTAIGLNEFAGYVGLAVAGIITAYLASEIGARVGILIFGLMVVTLAGAVTLAWVRDTLPWAVAERSRDKQTDQAKDVANEPPRGWEVFRVVSWKDRRLAAISQAGLVEKFVDALVWVFLPFFLVGRGLSLPEAGWVVGVYGFVWGGSQLVTGRLSDVIGRRWPTVGGMWICGAGIALVPMGQGILWWSITAAIAGLGMALLYPNLSAAVADVARADWRGAAIGVYRFWRDLGYAVGALGLGTVAHFTGAVEGAFTFVAASMILSGLVLWRFAGETRR